MIQKATSFLLALLLALCLVPLPSVAALQTERPYRTYFPVTTRQVSFTVSRIGPSLGRVLGVAQDPHNPPVAYAMTYGSGMYKTTDYGATWYPISTGISYLTLQALAIDPLTPTTLYAGTYSDPSMPYNGVFKTTDGGASWASTGEMSNVWNGVRYNKPVIYTLVVDPLNPNRIFAGARMKGLPNGALGGGGVFRTEDGGATWSPVNSGLPNSDLYVYDLALDPAHPGRVYAALHVSGLYRSDNYGSTWSKVQGPPYAGRAIAVHPTNPAVLYYGAVKKQAMRRSLNGGQDWSQIGDGGWDVTVGGLSPDPFHPDWLYAGILVNNTEYSLVRSTNRGSSWSRVAALNTWGRIAFSPDGQSALIGVDFDGPYRTVDGGLTWQRSAQGLSGYSVTGLLALPSNPDVLFATLYDSGVYYSKDAGLTWTPSSVGLGNLNLLSIAGDPANPSTLYVTTDTAGVYRTTDGGAHWSPVTGGYPAAPPNLILGEQPPPSPFENRPLPERDDLSDQVDAPTRSQSNILAGLARGNAIIVSPFDPQTVLVATTGRGIYRLTGAAWATTSQSSGTVYAITFDRSKSGRALAGASSGTGSLLVTTNNGQTWSPANTGLNGRTVYSLAQSPANPQEFLAGTDAGVYSSIDGGSSWASLALSDQAVKAVGISSFSPGVVYYAGTDQGAYFSDTLTDWLPLHTALDYTGVQGIVLDPSGQFVYIPTRLAGIVRVVPK